MEFESEFERKVFEERQEKLEKIEKLGQAKYPNRFPARQDETAIALAAVRAKWDQATAEELEAKRETVSAAGRIMAVAEVTGNAFGSDNAHWSNASEKHIAACIELFRQVEGPGGKECSVNEIQIFTTNEQYLTKYVNKLKKVITSKQVEGASPYEILLLRNLDDYFTGEWLKHDPKTKGNIQSCVTNLFGDVTRNEQLIKTFCLRTFPLKTASITARSTPWC